MISRLTSITIRIFSTCRFVRLPVLQFFLSISCLLCETSVFYPFFGSFLCLNRSGILQMRYTTAGRASYGGFPGQLLFRRKEEFAGNALQAAGSSAAADLCSWKTGRRWRRGNRNRPVNMMVKRGYGLAGYKCRRK